MVKTCPNCGKKNEDNEIFCECGYDIENVEPNGGGGAAERLEPTPAPQPTAVPKLVITTFKGRPISGEIPLAEEENIIAREDIAAATNNALDEDDYKYISRKEKGGHVKIGWSVPPPGGESHVIIEHVSQRAGVKTTVNGVGIEGKGKHALKDDDKIVLNDAFELIFKVQ